MGAMNHENGLKNSLYFSLCLDLRGSFHHSLYFSLCLDLRGSFYDGLYERLQRDPFERAQ
jgi:hypothetical protein